MKKIAGDSKDVVAKYNIPIISAFCGTDVLESLETKRLN